eukprot:5362343-Pyramimonas_sp.AAC.1
MTDLDVENRPRAKRQRRKELWRPMHKRISLDDISGPDGLPLGSAGPAGEALAVHWGGSLWRS